jgi:FAD dependent oxidoreductase
MDMKIAVVGAGIFGCTAAIKLARSGYDVTLFDKQSSILQSSSQINQYRLHRGYHYPRSVNTVRFTKDSVQDFENEFRHCIVKNYEHFYAIANYGSKVTPLQYIQFLKENKLEYEVVEPFLDSCQLVVKVNENSFDWALLYYDIGRKLNKHNIECKFNTTFTDTGEFDLIINATYANINDLLEPVAQRDYQFELVEKVIVKTPNQFKNKSLVIMDGDFCCIDPFGLNVDMSVLGHVKEAIHDSLVGKQYNVPETYKSVLNGGIWTTFTDSKHKKIINECEQLLGTKLDYFGSMYTVRTVLPKHEHDDARPTEIIKHNDRLISLFGGKIGTSVSFANELYEKLIL